MITLKLLFECIMIAIGLKFECTVIAIGLQFECIIIHFNLPLHVDSKRHLRIMISFILVKLCFQTLDNYWIVECQSC